MEHYTLHNPDESISSKKYDFCPTVPFRLVVAGSSESGKTKMIKYRRMETMEKTKDKEAPWYEDICFKIITPDKLPDISKFKNTGRKRLLVFDDLAGEPLSTQLKIIPFFRSGRHNNISSIFIGQRYFEINQNIRGNVTHISAHRGFGTLDSIKRVLKDMYNDYKSLAKKVYEVIKKHYVIIDI
ncbi:hypothetical protein Glove_460g21 [Diversispora epigaea]|uniref:Uncharacterized protein n=1 Tax=Diversispora epigaea TaxID=1348612 RepID=A0A397GNX6_9GLOM|nr:hypothetical protein Glove_460g21 [Diversispora epigaea]